MLLEYKVLSEKLATSSSLMHDITLQDARGRHVYNPMYTRLDKIQSSLDYIIVNTGMLRGPNSED